MAAVPQNPQTEIGESADLIKRKMSPNNYKLNERKLIFLVTIIFCDGAECQGKLIS